MDFAKLASMLSGIAIGVFFLGFVGFIFFYLFSFGWAFVTAFFWFFSAVGYHSTTMSIFLTLLTASLLLSAVRFLKSFMG